jgi:hypothetical protein
MASPFDVLDELLSSAVVTAYGEAAIITPRVSSQYAQRTNDTTRPQVNAWGVFSAGPGDQQIKGQTTGGEFAGSTRLGVMLAEFWMTKEQITALGFRPGKGDTVTLPGRAGPPVYSVAGIQDTDRGDVALILVREDQPQ